MDWKVFDLNNTPKSGHYMISTEYTVMTAYWNKRQKMWTLPGYSLETGELMTITNDSVKAFCNLPEPYKP